MNSVLTNFLRKFVLVFFEDILIYNSTMAQHVQYLRAMLRVLRSHELFAMLSKCTFAEKEVEYLGHIISGEEVAMAIDPAKISIIQSWPQLKTITQLRAFLDLIGYYIMFIHGYGIICQPLF